MRKGRGGRKEREREKGERQLGGRQLEREHLAVLPAGGACSIVHLADIH